MKTRVFTTGVIMNDGRILVLKRQDDDDAYPGLWDCVGGHFQEGESAERCMMREAKEESGLDVQIVRTAPLIEFIDRYGRAVALPFLLRPRSRSVRLSAEHSTFKWIAPRELRNHHDVVVPDLLEALRLFKLMPLPRRAALEGGKAQVHNLGLSLLKRSSP